MNTLQIQECSHPAFLAAWSRSFSSWLVRPAPLTVTCSEFLGSIEQEIQTTGDPAGLDKFALPEFDAEEFERVFNWFLA